MVSVLIPSYQKREDSSSSYTAFVVEVQLDGKTYILEKRYSEFAELHQKLRKIGTTPDFPPKNVFKWQPKVLEQRRHMFEVYLQTLLDSNGRVVPKTLATFLRLPLSVADTVSISSSSDVTSDDLSPCHQPVITFSERIYRTELAKASLPDIITEGVLDAMYHGKT